MFEKYLTIRVKQILHLWYCLPWSSLVVLLIHSSKNKSMRKVKKLMFIFLLSPAFFSCKKSSTTTNNAVNPTGSSMSASIEGSSWTASTVSGQKSTTNPVVLSMAGTGNGNQINMAIPNYAGPGTYSFSTNNTMTAQYINLLNPMAIFSANSVQGGGSITVSSDVNGVVEGTFNLNVVPATGGSAKNISGGNFRIQL